MGILISGGKSFLPLYSSIGERAGRKTSLKVMPFTKADPAIGRTCVTTDVEVMKPVQILCRSLPCIPFSDGEVLGPTEQRYHHLHVLRSGTQVHHPSKNKVSVCCSMFADFQMVSSKHHTGKRERPVPRPENLYVTLTYRVSQKESTAVMSEV